jgi:hypothetical protein
MAKRKMQSLFVAALLCAAPFPAALSERAGAQQITDQHQPRRWFDIPNRSPAQELQQLCAAGQYRAASAIIDRELDRSADDPNFLYNAACIACRLGELDLAGDRLMQSVKAGFRNFSFMRRDPDLIALRQHAIFRALVAARQSADSLLGQKTLQDWQARLEGKQFTLYVDQAHKFNVLTQLDAASCARVQAALASHVQRLQEQLFGPVAPQWVLVVLADDMDDADVSNRPHVQGVYRHERRELIAVNPHMSLRHEVVHMLHQFHMDELGQQHPIWIQEGLATLWEQYSCENGTDTRAAFSATERDTIAQALLAHGTLIPWQELFTLNEEEFQRQAYRTYAQCRSIMRFIASARDDDERERPKGRGGLREWYEQYTSGFANDPGGAQSLSRFYGRPVEEVEENWKAWLKAQAIVIDRRENNASSRR